MVAVNRGGRRSYESPVRRERAAATRSAILASARRLFASGGYERTTVETIAADADVAVRTVYTTYGTKRAILFGLLEQVAPTPREDLETALRDRADNPRAQLELAVSFTTKFFEAAGDLLDIVRQSAGTEPDVAEFARRGEEFRRRQQQPLIASWARGGALAEGLSEQRAADILWALTGADVYRLFIIERSWPARQFRAWLTETLAQLLLTER
jgi:AcrR family transcriptional regulator